MESKNHKVIKNFISENEVLLIVNWVDSLKHENSNPNYHLIEISKTLNGESFMIDISDNKLTNYITNFQSISKVSKSEVPSFIKEIIDRISLEIKIPKDNIFLQVIDMKKGGKISPHYDASYDGYINYKCNISVFAEDYEFIIDKDVISVQNKDIYCFEASLYKHWTEKKFNNRRVLLSFGFLVPYSLMGRNEDDPRVRLSKRIKKYFQ